MRNHVPAAATGLPLYLRPEEYPDIYASECVGRCLEPIIADGTTLLFSRDEPCRRGDIVGLLLHPDKMAEYGHSRIVKRLALGIPPDFWKPWRRSSAITPMVVVEMLNPRRTIAFKPGELLAIPQVSRTCRVKRQNLQSFD